MKKLLCLILAIPFSCSSLIQFSGSAISQEMPIQPTAKQMEEQFRTGQAMAECAAFFRFIAELPYTKDKPNTIEHAKNKANGWELASLLFILSGSTEQQQLHAKETIDYIVDAKKTEYLSRAETAGAQGLNAINDEFNKNCMPLVPLQEKTLEVMRRGISEDTKNE